MKTRQEIKSHALVSFTSKYWLCVGVNVVAGIVLGAVAGISCGVGALLLTPPIMIGLNLFSLRMYRDGSGTFDTVFTDGFQNYGRKLGGYLWMQLFTFLWSLLFLVPGIIKGLSYAMTPYILGDCPNVKAQDALKISMRMMNGHKWELFVFGLSFIGWCLLSGLTGGLLAIFYVSPYMNNSFAGYYEELKAASIASGVITEAELA